MVSAANRTMGRHGSVAGTEGPVPSANYDWGFPASRGEMVSEAARGDLDALVRLGGRDARAVTEHWRRSNRLCRCYARVGLLPKRGTPGNNRLCRKLGAACRIRCTPPHVAEADRSDACPQGGKRPG